MIDRCDYATGPIYATCGNCGRNRGTMSEDTQVLVAAVETFLNEHGLTADLVTASRNEETIIVELDADYVAEWSMGA